ncbi:Uu.00g122490.m01.CDS01 [Anthostomella pinea]|uniref:Uu.00g122490.m01.CDS01 n=1 Tax=Anthostomella pinea TaxID=933095 RepID=A0AAI8VI63_9PEZI|nr:Uu.00g122490.m01.CDS01 [Anthostomella pinea]
MERTAATYLAPETSLGDVWSLIAVLPSMAAFVPSKANNSPATGSSAVSTANRANTVTPGYGTGTTQSSSSGRPLVDTQNNQAVHVAPAPAGTVNAATTGSNGSSPEYFELCVNRSKHLVSLGEIQLKDCLGNVLAKNDIELFGMSDMTAREVVRIIQEHQLMLSFQQTFVSAITLSAAKAYTLLYRPSDIHFVRFAAQRGGKQTGIYESPLAIPPKAEVDQQHDHPATSGNPAWDMLFYNRLPKKLNNSLLAENDPTKIYRWGVHIIEGPNKPLIAWCVASILAASFAIALVHDLVRKEAIDSGFGIGQWIVAVLSTALTALYFHLEDAAV